MNPFSKESYFGFEPKNQLTKYLIWLALLRATEKSNDIDSVKEFSQGSINTKFNSRNGNHKFCRVSEILYQLTFENSICGF